MSQISAQTTSSSMGAVIELTGNTGTATPDGSGNINVIDSQGTAVFTGASHTLTHTYTDGNNNTGLGTAVLQSVTTGATNTALGYQALMSLVGGANNVALGASSGAAITAAGENTLIGTGSGILITGSNNTALGFQTLNGLVGGSYNCALGLQAGSAYVSSESSNISINSTGVAAESNVLRIGQSTGTGQSQLKAAYICGIAGVNVGSVATVVTETGDQLGTAVITAGTGISVGTSANTITISATGTTTLTYKAISSGPYTVLPTDDYLGVTSSSTGISILLPNSGSVGGTITVKDTSGNSSTFNITVTTVGGAVLIDGATTFVMNANYQAANFIWNGTSYEVF